jgi:hypothetical protein
MKELKGSLDFTSNSFKVRPNKAWFHPTTDALIHPGQFRIIHVKGKLPRHIKNSALLLNSGSYLTRFCPSTMMVKFKHGIAPIKIHNHTKKPIHFKAEKPIVYTNLDDFIHVTQRLPPDCLKQRQSYSPSPQSHTHVKVFCRNFSVRQ